MEKPFILIGFSLVFISTILLVQYKNQHHPQTDSRSSQLRLYKNTLADFPKAVPVHIEEQQKVIHTTPVSDCDLNDLISEGTISNLMAQPVRTHKYLNLKPSAKTLDKVLAQHIFQENGDYQKFYLLEKNNHFSSMIYRYDKDDYSTVHLTTINNNTCDLIDNVLLEERDVFQGKSVGTTSIQLDNTNFISTFYEEDMDYGDLDFWNNDKHAIKYEIDSTGVILEEYNGDDFVTDTLEL